jgi:hypothetical protein
MRPIYVALGIFLLCRTSPATAQSAESFYYYVPVVNGNFATTVRFVEDTAAQKVTVCIVNPRHKKVNISLYNSGMRYWYPILSGSCDLPFNFSKAEAGEYTIRVFVEDEKYVKKVVVKR